MYVLREVAAQFERTVLLFSGGKDSITMVHLARKAFWPARIPFPLLHIDTGHNFPETLEFRDRWPRPAGAELVVRTVQDSIDAGRCAEEPGPNPSRNALQTVTLLDALKRAEGRRGAGRRPARRGEGARQGALLQPPRPLRPVGSEEPAPRAVEPVQRPQASRRALPRLPALELDRARRLAVHRPRGDRAAPLYFAHAARWSSATGCCWRSGPCTTASSPASVRGAAGALPHRGRRDLHRAVGEHAAVHRGGDRPRGGRGAPGRARRPRRRPPERGGHGRPQAAGLLLMRKPRHPRAPAARSRRIDAALLRFTTAGSVDDGKSTLIGRLLHDTGAIPEDQLEAVEAASRLRGESGPQPGAAHRRPARRARAEHHHRRGLPLLRHAAAQASSSPTRPGTCSTRATW
jgi:hypothetical protein